MVVACLISMAFRLLARVGCILLARVGVRAGVPALTLPGGTLPADSPDTRHVFPIGAHPLAALAAGCPRLIRRELVRRPFLVRLYRPFERSPFACERPLKQSRVSLFLFPTPF